MANPRDEMNAFLAAAEPPPPEPKPADPPPAAEPEPKPPPEPKPAEDDEPIPPLADGDTAVPLSVLEAERGRRKDWKEKAIRAEVERDEARKQLEAARAAAQRPTQPQPPQHQPPLQRTLQEELLNERLNNSEDRLRDKIGDEAVDAMLRELPDLRANEPALIAQAFGERHPYGWLHQQVQRRRALAEIGPDPAAYRARLRAEVEAELAAKPPPAPPPAPPPPRPLPATPSIAGVRSAGARSDAWSGPPSLEDVLRRA